MFKHILMIQSIFCAWWCNYQNYWSETGTTQNEERSYDVCVCVLPEYKLDMNHPVETCRQTVDEVKRLWLLNCTVIWRCLKPHAESPSHRFCGYGSTPLFFLRRTSHEGSIWVRFSGHWKPSLNDDQPDSCLALTGKVWTRTTSMELPNELA